MIVLGRQSALDRLVEPPVSCDDVAGGLYELPPEHK